MHRISGHKTASMFHRYNIVSATDQRDALRQTAAHLAAQPKNQQDADVVETPGHADAVSQ